MSSGVVTTIMGTGIGSYGGDNGRQTSAMVNYPLDLSVDTGNGDMYVSDSINHRIRVASGSTTLVTTFAGIGTVGTAGDGSAATSAQLNYCQYMHLDTLSKLYFAEYVGNRIRMVYSTTPTVAPTMPTIIPSMLPTVLPSVLPTTTIPSKIPTVVPTVRPTTIAPTRDPTKSPSFRPSNIRSSINTAFVVAGNGDNAISSAGSRATATSIVQPTGVWVNGSSVFFAESGSHCIRMYDSSSIVVNVAGVCSSSGSYNGESLPATAAMLNYPYSLMGSSVGSLYFADRSNNRIRQIASSVVSTFVGTSSITNSGDGGPRTSATIADPVGLWISSAGVIYVTSFSFHVCRCVDATGIISTFAGKSDSAGSTGDGGPATSAYLNFPVGLFGETTGVVYIADSCMLIFLCYFRY